MTVALIAVAAVCAWAETAAPLGARPEDAVVWQELAKLKSAKAKIALAEKYVNAPIPDCPDEWYLDFTRNGNRTRYQKPYFERLTALNALTLAEKLENRGRFLAEIARRLDSICAERSWVMPAHDRSLSAFNGKPHIDLGATHRATAVGFALGLLGEWLPSNTVARARAELNRRVIDPLLWTYRHKKNNPYFGSWHVRSNWNAVCNGGSAVAALMTVKDPAVREEVVRGWYEAMPFYLEGFTPDGYCSEGIGYWDYGYGEFIASALFVRRTTKGAVDAFALPRARKAFEYGYGIQVEYMKAPQFADGSGDPSADILALGELVWPEMKSTAGRRKDRLTGTLMMVIARNFGGEGQLPPPGKVGSLPLDTLGERSWFPDAQVLIVRAPGKTPFGVAMKGGHNDEQHNHNDVGSYAVMLDGVFVTGDPGGEIYTARTFSKQRYQAKVLSSYGHPVPLPAGQLQSVGRRFAAKTLATEFTADRDRLVLDLKGAYAASNLVSLVRTFDFDRKSRLFTVTDKVEFAAPSSFASPVVTYADVFADYATDRYEFRKGKQAVAVTAAATGGAWRIATELIENPLRASAKRLSLEFAEPVRTAEVTWTFQAR